MNTPLKLSDLFNKDNEIVVTLTDGWQAANSTTALQLQDASGTSVLNVDTTNGRVGIGTAGPGAKPHVYNGVMVYQTDDEDAI